MKKTDLVAMIRTIVAEEVRKQLPHIVAEMYFRNGSQPLREKTLEDTFEDELTRNRESVPRPMNNSDEGIYDDSGPFGRKNEGSTRVASLLLSNQNPMAELYETIAPTTRNKERGQPAPLPSGPQVGVPLEALGIDVRAIRENLKAAEKAAADKASAVNDTLGERPEDRINRIKLYRQSLERPVG
jgi:hypothetical protein